MVKYELIKNHVELKSEKEIKAGCTITGATDSAEIIQSFEDKYDALEELQKYTTEVRELSGSAGTYYHVTEYYVEENMYDKDGEWADGGDVLLFSKMPQLKQ